MSFDAGVAGTSTAVWSADPRSHDRPLLNLDGVEELYVVAAHPDDETLGAGALIAQCSRRGIPVTIIVVTDGGASGEPGIVATRSRELAEAASILGAGVQPVVIELGFADGATREQRVAISAAVAMCLPRSGPAALIMAPWRGDGHRDHRIVGEIVAEIVGELAGPHRFAEYLIWMWHWAHPGHDAVPWHDMASSAPDATRDRAIGAFRSQTQGDNPVLRPDFLEHFMGNREYYVERQRALPASFFDATYERHDDPWGLATRWYEMRKRALMLASLPRERYDRVLEIGCSIGITTLALLERADRLLAVDVSAAAVERARERVGDRAAVEVRDVVRDFPTGSFDLVVLSEVGYYFGKAGLATVLTAIEASLSPTGTLVACHWRHPVADYPLSGDEVHAAVAGLGLSRLTRHEEDDFLLEVFCRDSRSVAAQTGLL